jgi:hypothetical protein
MQIACTRHIGTWFPILGRGAHLRTEYLHATLQGLLESAISEDRATQDESILEIAMLLEKSTLMISGGTTSFPYESVLSPFWLAIKLDETDQKAIVEGLTAFISSDRRIASMLWALGKSLPTIGINPLLTLLHDYADEFTDEELYQALITLDNFLISDKGTLIPEIAGPIRHNNPLSSLQKMTGSRDPRLAKLARRVIENLTQTDGRAEQQ